MNARNAKSLRRLAMTLATSQAGLVEDPSTLRIKTETDPMGKVIGRVRTVTMVNAKGSFRNILKRLKRDEIGTLKEFGVI